jgi:hypothetical protein
MTDAEYEAERARIAPDKAAAGIRWEQALAGLFHRSGWTQEKLAKKEGKGQQYVSRLLVFGRFLAVLGNTPIGVNLAEGRFRGFWDRTAHLDHERLRFAEVRKMIEIDAAAEADEKADEADEADGPRASPRGYPKAIVEKFADGKWHSLPVIAKHLDASDKEAKAALAHMVKAKRGQGDARTETKRVGTVEHYRLFRNTRLISSAELIEKLAPIVEKLEKEGRKNQVTMSVMTVAVLATQLRKLLTEWAE